MDRDKAGAKCHLHMDTGHLNCHKCCELAQNGKRITESVTNNAIVVGLQLDVKYTFEHTVKKNSATLGKVNAVIVVVHQQLKRQLLQLQNLIQL